ncbi:hypothetical protein [Asticcacaulis excentricus]|uniref:Uncharacterized protein n=1 Tax=Asticcacaulis excentricus (strain ATCC 15261 / DSM 4724 / KCTC 12464 / NCIMB 9791 / VKM B-1370 / CB 48) TaxID=573065 RepID=E8RMR6_ASTEC|nr:hypothetical protein [Asticcacaulis excentricus]ADU13947.1 hypothetical protein Astex_2293 [Asticcacaulis excentricus CB 48]
MPKKRNEPFFNDGEVEAKGSRRINLTSGLAVRTVILSAGRGDWLKRRHTEMFYAAKGAPEAVVKMWSGGKTFRSVAGALDYVSRSGHLTLTNEDDEKIQGPDQLHALALEWRDGGSPIPDESAYKEYECFVFCAPKPVDPGTVYSAASEVISEAFEGFQYVKVMHTKETDPSPRASEYPHLHLIVKSRSLAGDRFRPGWRSVMYLRERYAQALRDRGVEMAATRKFARFRDAGHEKPLGAEKPGFEIPAEDRCAFNAYSALWERLQTGGSLERLQAGVIAGYVHTHTGIDLERSIDRGGPSRER